MEIIVRTLHDSHDNIQIITETSGKWFWWQWEKKKQGNGHIYPSLQSALLGVFEALRNLAIDLEIKRQ